MPKRMSFAHLKKKPSEAEVSPAPVVSTSGLIESRFCYGCLNFSVDYPETSKAIYWCRRDEPDGIRFKRIFPNFLIRQCPGKSTE